MLEHVAYIPKLQVSIDICGTKLNLTELAKRCVIELKIRHCVILAFEQEVCQTKSLLDVMSNDASEFKDL
jgi:hypothetical protein